LNPVGDAVDFLGQAFTKDEHAAAEKLGELFGTGWPETDKGNLISFPNLSQKQQELPDPNQEALVNQ
jgi:hypothetical protein